MLKRFVRWASLRWQLHVVNRDIYDLKCAVIDAEESADAIELATPTEGNAAMLTAISIYIARTLIDLRDLEHLRRTLVTELENLR